MVRYPKQSAIYWFDPEPVIGSEFKKVRPGIIVSPNEMNEELNTVLIVPLTTNIKPWPFRVTVVISGQKSSAECDQLRVIDKQRLRSYIGDLQSVDRDNLHTKLHTILS